MPDELVMLINVFGVPPEDGNRFLAAWEKVRDYLETQPGYIDTALHQKHCDRDGLPVCERRPLGKRRGVPGGNGQPRLCRPSSRSR